MRSFVLLAPLVLLIPALRAQPTESPPPRLTADAEGFRLASADGRYAFRLGGVLQTDAAFYADDGDGLATDALFLRRARPHFDVTLGQLAVRFHPDFGGGQVVIRDAYVEARLTPSLAAVAGKFKVPLGLEALRSDADAYFAERAFPSSLLPQRDVGLALTDNSGPLIYALGVFNGVADNENGETDRSDPKDVAARVLVRPFGEPLDGLGLGLAAGIGAERGTPAAPALPAYRTSGRRTFARFRAGADAETAAVADGVRARVTPQAHLYVGPVGVIAEYVLSEQRVRRDEDEALLRQTAWQVSGVWALTGERQGSSRIRPARPLDAGGRGALELAARVHALALDEDAFPTFADPSASARSAFAWAAGLNWYPTMNLRVTANLERTTFDAAEDGGELPAETLVLGRAQVAF